MTARIQIAKTGGREDDENMPGALVQYGNLFYLLKLPEGNASLIRAIKKWFGEQFNIVVLSQFLTYFDMPFSELIRRNQAENLAVLSRECEKELDKAKRNKNVDRFVFVAFNLLLGNLEEGCYPEFRKLLGETLEKLHTYCRDSR